MFQCRAVRAPGWRRSSLFGGSPVELASFNISPSGRTRVDRNVTIAAVGFEMVAETDDDLPARLIDLSGRKLSTLTPVGEVSAGELAVCATVGHEPLQIISRIR